MEKTLADPCNEIRITRGFERSVTRYSTYTAVQVAQLWAQELRETELYEIPNCDSDQKEAAHARKTKSADTMRVGLNRPYGDLDMHLKDAADMDMWDGIMCAMLHKVLGGIGKDVRYCLLRSTGMSRKGPKVSWRFTLPSVAGPMSVVKAVKSMIQHNLVAYLDLHGHHAAYKAETGGAFALDDSVYNGNGKMRMLHSSKAGYCCRRFLQKSCNCEVPGAYDECRPLTLVHGEPEDTLITYIPEGTILLCDSQLPQPPPARVPLENRVVRSGSGTLTLSGELTQPVEAWDRVVALCNLLSVERLQRRGFTSDAAAKGCRDLIAALKGVEVSERSKALAVEVCMRGRYQLKSDGPAWLAARYDEAPTDRGNMGSLVQWARADNPEGYKALAPLQRSQRPSHLAEITGLTAYGLPAIRYCEPYLRDLPLADYDTLLVKSHLGTGKTTQMKRMAKGPYKRIAYVSGRITFTMSMCNDFNEAGLNFRSYLDPEVRGDLGGVDRIFCQVESLHRFRTHAYDVLVMDEAETILMQCSPSECHQGRHSANMESLEALIRGAKKVVVLDAFLTDRSLDVMKALRGDTTTVLIENTVNPYERTMERVQVMHENSVKRMVEDIGGTYEAFTARILGSLRAGKRTVVVWGSREKGLTFEKRLQQAFPDWHRGRQWLFYHSEEDMAQRKATLANINTTWAQVQLLMYSSSITIGLNYDNRNKPYDDLYVYGTPGGCTPRDTAQSMLRCRFLTSNHLTYMIDTRCPRPHSVGLAAVRAEAEQSVAMTKSLLKAYNEVEADYTRLPPWVQDVVACNRNERNVSVAEYEAVLNHYLAQSGYTLQKTAPSMLDPEDEWEVPEREPPPFDAVAVLSEEDVEDIRRRRIAMKSVSPEELYAVSKFYYLRRVEDGARGEVAELWPMWCDRHRGEKVIRHISDMKRKSVAVVLQQEACVASHCLDSMGAMPLRFEMMARIYEALGVKPHEAKTYSAEEWGAVCDRVAVFAEDAKRVFQYRDRAAKGKVHAPVKVKQLICHCLESWVGYQNAGADIVLTCSRSRVGGERVPSYSAVYQPNITARIWEVCRGPV